MISYVDCFTSICCLPERANRHSRGQGSHIVPCLPLQTLRHKMASTQALAYGDASDLLCRPCVDCGRVTERFCDGIDNDCFAAVRIPSEPWCEWQRTPLCGPCEQKHEACHFCRGVHSCRPFAKGGMIRSGYKGFQGPSPECISQPGTLDAGAGRSLGLTRK